MYKKLIVIFFIAVMFFLTACTTEDTNNQLNNPVKTILLPSLGEDFTLEDYTDYGVWLLKVERKALSSKLSETGNDYVIEICSGNAYPLSQHKICEDLLVAFLPDRLEKEQILQAGIKHPNDTSQQRDPEVDSLFMSDVIIEAEEMQNATNTFQIELIDYLQLKDDSESIIFSEEDRLIRPAYVISNEKNAYLIKKYRDARQVSDSKNTNGAFAFLKDRTVSEHNAQLSFINPNRTQLEFGGNLLFFAPDNRKRLRELGVEGDPLDEGIYQILEDSVNDCFTIQINSNKIREKAAYQECVSYSIVFSEATECNFTATEQAEVYEATISCEQIKNIELVRNARFEGHLSPVIAKVSGPTRETEEENSIFEWEEDLSGTSGRRLVNFQFIKDTDDWTELSESSYTWTGYAEGEHLFKVRAVDERGATSNVLEWTFTYSVPGFKVTIIPTPCSLGDIKVNDGEWESTITCLKGLESGDTLTLSATLNDSVLYRFDGWYESFYGNLYSKSTELNYTPPTITRDATYLATFMRNEWIKNYGGNYSEEFQSVITTDDGKFVAAGYSNSTNKDLSGHARKVDGWIINFDCHGTILWNHTYGGSDAEKFYDIKQTGDGGYILVGQAKSSDGDLPGNKGKADGWIIKLNSDGGKEWSRNYGGSENDFLTSVIETEDGAFVAAGSSSSKNGDLPGNKGNKGYSDGWIIKVNGDNGDKIWSYNFGGTYRDSFEAVAETADHDYLVAGSSWSKDYDLSGHHYGKAGIQQVGIDGTCDGWIMKISEAENNTLAIDWCGNYGTTSIDVLYALQSTDNGIFAAGYIAGKDEDFEDKNYGSVDGCILKIAEETGEVAWAKNYGGSRAEYFFDLREIDGGNFAAVGRTSSSDHDLVENYGNDDGWLFKIDGDGNIIDHQSRNYGGSQGDYLYSVTGSQDGSIIAVGKSYSNDHDLYKKNYGRDNTWDAWIVKRFTVY